MSEWNEGPAPAFSVVIPLYNKERHVERAVRSAQAQTRSPLEIVVVDDGSTDGGADMVGRMAGSDPRIRLIRQENGGVSRARNVGIEAARGSHVAFLDADDEWKPGYLEEISTLIYRFPQAGAYCTRFVVVDEVGRASPAHFASLNPSRVRLFHNFFKTFLQGTVMWTSATVVPKATFATSGLFFPGMGRGQDVDLWWRIGAWFDIAYSRACMAIYYKNVDNSSAKRERDAGNVLPYSAKPLNQIRLESLAKDGRIDPSRRRWMRELIAWRNIRRAYRYSSKRDPDCDLGTVLRESWGTLALVYSLPRLLGVEVKALFRRLSR